MQCCQKVRIMMSKVKVEQASQEEYPAIKRLRLEALQDDPSNFGMSFEEESLLSDDQFKKRFFDEKRLTLVARKDDEIVGMCNIVFRPEIKLRHIAEVYAIYVHPKHRSQGIGNAIMKECIRVIRERPHIIKARLGVIGDNTHARSLYEKFGFRVVGTLKKELYVHRHFFDEVEMELFFDEE